MASTHLIEYSENRELSGSFHLTTTELLVTFSIVKLVGGLGTEIKKIYFIHFSRKTVEIIKIKDSKNN